MYILKCAFDPDPQVSRSMFNIIWTGAVEQIELVSDCRKRLRPGIAASNFGRGGVCLLTCRVVVPAGLETS